QRRYQFPLCQTAPKVHPVSVRQGCNSLERRDSRWRVKGSPLLCFAGCSEEPRNWAVSSRQRNELGEFLLWHHIAEGLAGPSVEGACNIVASQRSTSNVPNIGATLERWVMLP